MSKPYKINVTADNFNDFLPPEVSPKPYMSIEEAKALDSAQVYQKSVELFGEGSENPIAVSACLFYEIFPDAYKTISDPTEENRPQRHQASILMHTIIEADPDLPVAKMSDTSDTRNWFIRGLYTFIQPADGGQYTPYEVLDWLAHNEHDEASQMMLKDQEALDKCVAWYYRIKSQIVRIKLLGYFNK